MNISKNIYNSIMCGRLFKIISKHDVKCQFGSTPGVVCQYVTFTIKTLLHLRNNHNLTTWVSIAYLVKAFNTSNHALLIAILENMAHPQDYAQKSNACTKKSYSSSSSARWRHPLTSKWGLNKEKVWPWYYFCS